MTYTVIGVWIGDFAYTVGVIEGEHDVAGGDMEQFPEGCWATAVEAESVARAELAAIEEMESTLSDDWKNCGSDCCLNEE